MGEGGCEGGSLGEKGCRLGMRNGGGEGTCEAGELLGTGDGGDAEEKSQHHGGEDAGGGK